VSVNIGGDARVINSDDSMHDWNFDVCDTQSERIWSTVSLRQGAIATSSMDARHRVGIGPQQHIFSLRDNPSEIAICSVIAGNATWAEVWTKLLFFSNDVHNDIQKRGLAALVIDTNGQALISEKWKEYSL
jgi:thiamine biosynthesis lipoprotein ApbE